MKVLKDIVRREAAACELDAVTAWKIVERVLIRTPELEFDEDYTLKEVCGEVFWTKYEYVGRRIGRFFSRMVRTGVLQWRKSRLRSDNNQLYRRT